MSKAALLYDEDFVQWSEEQASALRNASRSGTNLPLDWENLAEEVESLGRSQRAEMRSRIRNILEHLIKLRCSPVAEPRAGWADTIMRERADLELLFQDSPSLRCEAGEVVADQTPRAARLAISSFNAHGQASADLIARVMESRFNEDRALGDWLPEGSG